MAFDYTEKKEWMSKNWQLSIYVTVGYITSIFLAQSWMKNRQAFQLRKPLAVWNIALSIFSILATIRTLPELLNILKRDDGFHHTVCSPCEDVSPDSAFWAWAFVLSKVVELGDTAFIILRKQPLIFLHWYHHMTVLIYAWYSYGDYIAPARWFVVMNYFVHSLMYTYYAFKSMRFSIPKWCSIIITCLQLSQMVLGVTVNVYAYKQKNNNVKCDVDYHHLHIGLGTYASYFFLFSNFFYRAYFTNRKQKAQ